MSLIQLPVHRARTRRALVSIAVASLLAACGGGAGTDSGITTPPVTGPGGPVATTAVSMRGFAFDPSAIVVSPGATVTFTNLDGTDHNVTFDNATIGGSGNFATGTTSMTMPAATGTYAYRCTLHAGMSGTVTVQ